MKNKEKEQEAGGKMEEEEERRECPALASLRSYFEGSTLPLRAKEYRFEHTLRSVLPPPNTQPPPPPRCAGVLRPD